MMLIKIDDKKAAADARTKLARAFKDKAKSVNEKYIVPPKISGLLKLICSE